MNNNTNRPPYQAGQGHSPSPGRPAPAGRVHRPSPSKLPRLEQTASPTAPSRSLPPQYRQQQAPWELFQQAPKRSKWRLLTILRALWQIITFPLSLLFFLLRNLPKIVLIPLRILISCCFVGGMVLIALAVIYALKAKRYDLSQIARMPERSIVLDRKGAEIGTLHGENRRQIKKLKEEVPPYFIDALIVQEDRRFWEHHGIDPIGILRAISQVFKHGRTTQGASTLTMQLAKNTYNHRDRNLDSKLTEVALARLIESTYDKELILQCYINRIFWGHTFLGLKQAANGYFCKKPLDLTIGEAALLAGIICNPNEFSPHRNPEAAKTQRDKVLALMLRFGSITSEQYKHALAEPVQAQWPDRHETDNYAQDLVRAEVDHILRILDKQEQSLRDEILYSGGLRVQTSLDLSLQDDIMQAMDAKLVSLLEERSNYPHQTRAAYQAAYAKMTPEQQSHASPQYVQGACVLIHQSTGAILAAVGGRNSNESSLNRAVQSRRQVGSLFKPLVYTTYFEQGGSPQSLISDNRIQKGEIAGAPTWSPRNADSLYKGQQAASWGLLKSRNTMSVRIGNKAGLSNIIRKAELAGYRKPSKGNLGPTIYLGTWEASPFEVASAYTCFANGGIKNSPYLIDSITNNAGEILWQRDRKQHRIFSQKASNATTKILEQITKPGGTAGSIQGLGFKAPCGGKTGTTNNYTNAWYCGFTSELTAAVWVGFDKPTRIIDKGYGGTLALPIWVDIMKAAQAHGFPMADIHYSPASGSTQAQWLCRSSGQLAHAGCEYAGTAYKENMTESNKQLEYCCQHDYIAEELNNESDEVQAIDPDEYREEEELQAVEIE